MKNFLSSKKLEIAVGGTFFVMLIIFIIANPQVFLSYRIYIAVFTTLPILIILATSLVFVVSVGEIDLSFPALMGIGGLVFSQLVQTGISPFIAIVGAVAASSFLGFINGVLIAKLGLSSLILTLGMNFFIRGFILISTQGVAESIIIMKDSAFYGIIIGNRMGAFPTQMLWAIIWVIFLWLLFHRHRFGGQTLFTGDNINSAREMGVNVDRIKILTFVLMGAGSGFAGILITSINNSFQPTTGDGYLLIGLAAVFIGGTPSWGGRGTIFGAVVGAFILGFIEAGIIGAGLTGFYTRFFYGLIMILAIISHRFTGIKKI